MSPEVVVLFIRILLAVLFFSMVKVWWTVFAGGK